MTTLADKIEALAKDATPGPYCLIDWLQDDGAEAWMLTGQTPEILHPGQTSIWPDGIRQIPIADFEEGTDREVMGPLVCLLLNNLPTILRALRERDQAVEALRKVRAEGMNNFNTRCKPWWKSICTTLASIEGTGHE